MTLTDMTAALRRDAGLRAPVAQMIAMNRCAGPDEIAGPIPWLPSDEAPFLSGGVPDALGRGLMRAPLAPP
jgi:NAD(P)-dependent dehydrogenase (short-subunit alcohol dehydrogenase family)